MAMPFSIYCILSPLFAFQNTQGTRVRGGVKCTRKPSKEPGEEIYYPLRHVTQERLRVLE